MNDAAMDTPLASDFRAALSAAIAYWEPRRLLYNGWLEPGAVHQLPYMHQRAAGCKGVWLRDGGDVQHVEVHLCRRCVQAAN